MTDKYSSVWDALEDTPQEAENMKLRSELMLAISKSLSEINGTQMQKAKALGITQPRLNDLLNGRINKFTIDALVNIATAAGLHVSLATSLQHGISADVSASY